MNKNNKTVGMYYSFLVFFWISDKVEKYLIKNKNFSISISI